MDITEEEDNSRIVESEPDDLQEDIGVWIVDTENYHDKVVKKIRHTILAKDAVEAAQIIQNGLEGIDEKVVLVSHGTHISKLPTNLYQIVPRGTSNQFPAHTNG